MRVWLTNILMLAQAVAFLVHFGLIVKYGRYLIQEPNVAILVAEITLFLVIIGFGVYNLITYKRRT